MVNNIIKTPTSNFFVKRLIMALAGVLLCGVSVSIFNLSAFGVDPFQCLAQGLHIPFAGWLSYGTFYTMVSLVLLIIAFFLERHYIGPATFFNMFFLGYIVDWTTVYLQRCLPSPGIFIRLMLLVSAIILTCFAASLYYTGNFGISVYDTIPLSIARRKVIIAGKIIHFKSVRIFCDIVCVFIGTCFGKIPGVGTIATAFFMGPLIDWFNTHVTSPFLYDRISKSLTENGEELFL